MVFGFEFYLFVLDVKLVCALCFELLVLSLADLLVSDLDFVLLFVFVLFFVCLLMWLV